jgi:drug/metabolite transporter (DMT)-like permease
MPPFRTRRANGKGFLTGHARLAAAMTDTRAPARTTMTRPPPVDLVLLAVAVAAVSTSAPLIRGASAPSLAIAMWRCAMALPVLGVAVALSARSRRQLRSLVHTGPTAGSGAERRRSGAAGLLLALHFSAWVPSLSFTSVASSTALVATQPVWAALIARWRGEHVPRAAWAGIGVAMAGAVVLSGVDLSIEPRALLGDMLALLGGALAAAYVTVGADVRRTVTTGVYALVCYSVAAVALLVVCLAGRQALGGYDAGTWWALVGLTVGPQLLGHTVVNRVLSTTSATLVSVAILFEVVGAALLAWVFFGEMPPLSAAPAGVLIATGLVMVVRASGRAADAGALD